MGLDYAERLRRLTVSDTRLMEAASCEAELESAGFALSLDDKTLALVRLGALPLSAGPSVVRRPG